MNVNVTTRTAKLFSILAVTIALALNGCGGGGTTGTAGTGGTGGSGGTSGTNVTATLTSFAGDPYGPGNLDGTGAAARFYQPSGVATDSAGNVYVADTNNHIIRKITSAGVVTVFAGTAGLAGHADGTGVAATFNYPMGVATDSAGNVYVADTFNNTIRKITPAAVVTTLAGSALVAAGSTDSTGASALFNHPQAIATDSMSNVYVADTYNSTIRKITPAGVVTTFAGTAGLTGSVDATGAAARFSVNGPSGVATDSAGNVYVADRNNFTIRKITPAGAVTTWAGAVGVNNSIDGTGTAANFMSPNGIATDSAGNVYVSEVGSQIVRKITPAAVVTTLAGTPITTGGSSVDGTGAAARFNYPAGVATDSTGNVYVADTFNNTIRKITPAAVVTTIAGAAGVHGYADGTGAAAVFYQPDGMAIDSVGNLYVADSGNNAIRKITPAGVTTTFAGIGGPFGAGSIDGTVTTARFTNPRGLAFDSTGNLYVGDSTNRTVRKITPAGAVTTLAGTALVMGSADGTGSGASFCSTGSLATDSVGNVYVADWCNQTIRKITPAGVVTTLAGSAGLIGSADGTGAAARFNYPYGVATDSADNVYVADGYNHTIRKITPAGVVTTLAGTALAYGSADGTGAAARFNLPYGITTDSAGNLYVAENGNSAIRKITPAGVVTTLVGQPGLTGFVPGSLPGILGITHGVALYGNMMYISNENGIASVTVTTGSAQTAVSTLPGLTKGEVTASLSPIKAVR